MSSKFEFCLELIPALERNIKKFTVHSVPLWLAWDQVDIGCFAGIILTNSIPKLFRATGSWDEKLHSQALSISDKSSSDEFDGTFYHKNRDQNQLFHQLSEQTPFKIPSDILC